MLAVFRQHPQRRNALGLLSPDAALAGLMAEPEGDEGLGSHGKGEQEIQHPYHRHHGIGAHEQAGERGEEHRHQSADGHPGVDLHQIGRVGVLDQQAEPGRLVYLLKAVEHRRNEEHPEILRHRPHQAGDGPAEKVTQHGGELAAQLVGKDAAPESDDHLHRHGNRKNQSDLHVSHAQGVHVKGGKGGDQVVGDAPQRLDENQGAGVAVVVCQHPDQGVLFPFCILFHGFSSACRLLLRHILSQKTAKGKRLFPTLEVKS